jgi:TraB/PrgY/gumN family
MKSYKAFIFSLLLCLHSITTAQSFFVITDSDGRYRGALIGVFHYGVSATSSLKSFIANDINKSSELILEQNPSGGWSPTLAKAVYDIRNIKTDLIIQSDNFPCLKASKKLTAELGPGYAALFTTDPSAYFLMLVKPKMTSTIPNITESIEKWLQRYYNSNGDKRIAFLEEHIDPFKRLSAIDPYVIMRASEIHCERFRNGQLDKKENQQDFTKLIKHYEASEYAILRKHHLDAFRAAGWTEQLINNQYSDREIDFSIKMIEKLNSSTVPLMFTVGAAHIGGVDGLDAGLNNSQYKLTRCEMQSYRKCFKNQ